MMPPNPVRRAIPADARLSSWTTPDGWPLRRLDWPVEGARGRVLVQGGRGDFIEKYLETFADLHERGWSVTAFDWRGQGGSGRLSANPHVGHADDFGVFVADLAAFWTAWSMEATGPRAIIGHSMGGHLLLRALVGEVIDPTAAVLVAPMLGLKAPVGARLAARLVRIIARLGDPARAAWRTNERPGARVSRQKLLTSDASRYEDEQWWYRTTPALRLGPPSWAWLAEAFASTLALERDPRIDTLAVPLLMLVADHDGLVDPRAARRIAARLPQATLIRFGPESAHEILRESDAVRARALNAIEAFLSRHVTA